MRHVFAGVRVRDLAEAAEWYERLLGRASDFAPNDTELVWDLNAGGSLFLDATEPERAGSARVTVFVDDVDAFVTAAATRGIDPVRRETYDNDVRHVTFHDPDGNDISFGSMPDEG